MHAEPIVKRLNDILNDADRVIKLINNGWTDRCIAGYIGYTDSITIKRFRKLYSMYGENIKSYVVVDRTLRLAKRLS